MGKITKITRIASRLLERDNQNKRSCIIGDGQDNAKAVRKLLVRSVTGWLGRSGQFRSQLWKRRLKIWWRARTSILAWSTLLEKIRKDVKKVKKMEKKWKGEIRSQNRDNGRCLREQAGDSRSYLRLQAITKTFVFQLET